MLRRDAANGAEQGPLQFSPACWPQGLNVSRPFTKESDKTRSISNRSYWNVISDKWKQMEQTLIHQNLTKGYICFLKNATIKYSKIFQGTSGDEKEHTFLTSLLRLTKELFWGANRALLNCSTILLCGFGDNVGGNWNGNEKLTRELGKK